MPTAEPSATPARRTVEIPAARGNDVFSPDGWLVMTYPASWTYRPPSEARGHDFLSVEPEGREMAPGEGRVVVDLRNDRQESIEEIRDRLCDSARGRDEFEPEPAVSCRIEEIGSRRWAWVERRTRGDYDFAGTRWVVSTNAREVRYEVTGFTLEGPGRRAMARAIEAILRGLRVSDHRMQLDAALHYVVRFAERMWVTREPTLVAGGNDALERVRALMGARAVDPDLESLWPDVEVRDLTIDGDVATIDFSADVLNHDLPMDEERFAVQQLAWTLADLAVRDLVFTVEGASRGEASNGKDIAAWWGNRSIDRLPTKRRSDALAPITIDDPPEGRFLYLDELVVRGEALVLEANVVVRVWDREGGLVLETPATAERRGQRSPWRTRLRFDHPRPEGPLLIEAVEVSTEDGTDSFVASRTIRFAGY